MAWFWMWVADQVCFSEKSHAQSEMVVGVDISRKLLLKAKEQAKSFRNVLVLQADADHLPFQDAFFDIVFAFTVLQNMPKPVRNTKRVKASCQTQRQGRGNGIEEGNTT